MEYLLVTRIVTWKISMDNTLCIIIKVVLKSIFIYLVQSYFIGVGRQAMIEVLFDYTDNVDKQVYKIFRIGFEV